MSKIKDFLHYENNPVSFLVWWHHKQVKKYIRLMRDPSFQPSRFY